MLNCPVCDAKYTEEQEICSSCCWPFNVDFEKITEQITWAKQVWHNQRQSELNSRELEEKHKKLEEKYKELEEKYKELEDNKQQNESLDAQLKVLTSQLSDLTSKHDEDVQFLLNEIKQLKKEQRVLSLSYQLFYSRLRVTLKQDYRLLKTIYELISVSIQVLGKPHQLILIHL